MFETIDPYDDDDQDPADQPVPAGDDGLIPDEDLVADDGGLIPVEHLADESWLDGAVLDEAAQAVTDLEAELAAVALSELDADGILERLTASRQAERRAQADRLELAAHWADLNGVLDGPTGVPGCERLVRPGGDGTPQLGEFCLAELGVVLEVTDHAAVSLLADALDLRHRLPRLWTVVQAGRVEVWQARQVAERTRSLSQEAAGRVDVQIGLLAGKLSWRRFAPIIKKAILQADPPKALSDAEQAKANSGVFLSPEVEHGYATMIINARAGDVQALDQMLDLVARALKILGDSDGPDQRRATAVGYLADPQATLDLLAQAETQRQADSQAAAARRTGHPDQAEVVPDAAEAVQEKVDRRPCAFKSAVLYYHVSKEALDAIARFETHAGGGVGRVEGVGPVILDQIKEWLGHANVTVKPVIDLDTVAPVDCYEAPARISEAIRLRHPGDYYPYGTSLSPTQDNEHVVPYVPKNRGGPPGQTNPATMANTTRRHHRVKTFAGWTVRQVRPGAWLWRTVHGYHFLVDQHGTTALGRL